MHPIERHRHTFAAALALSVVSAACAAPDEQRLGKDAGYPVGKAANRDWLSGAIQYDRKPTHRFTSQSMAKSVTALAIGFALRDGYIKSLDDRVDRYATGLKGTLLGETTVRHLLRMASGARIVQTNDGTGDSGRFDTALAREGVEAAARTVTERDVEAGTRFAWSTTMESGSEGQTRPR